ncbi:MAG: cytidine deaminase [Planctomycetota bacterium]|nr:cytidine deaminase [Planctomycetota bacterium]
MVNDQLRRQLIESAVAVREQAHAPYSGFKVGAALIAEEGAIFSGCNIENSSLGLTICAERVAIGAAISAGAKKFQAICVVSKKGASPCGACRQFISEFGDDIIILVVDADGNEVKKEIKLKELLPDSFSL